MPDGSISEHCCNDEQVDVFLKVFLSLINNFNNLSEWWTRIKKKPKMVNLKRFYLFIKI